MNQLRRNEEFTRFTMSSRIVLKIFLWFFRAYLRNIVKMCSDYVPIFYFVSTFNCQFNKDNGCLGFKEDVFNVLLQFS